MKRTCRAFFIKSLMGLSFLSLIGQNSYALQLDRSFQFTKRLTAKNWKKTEKNVYTSWRLVSGARNFERDSDDSTVFQTTGTGVLQLRFLDSLRFLGSFSTRFQTGRSQSRFGDLSPDSGVYVNDAYVFWSPFEGKDPFTVEVGALDQDRTVNNRVLVKGSAFPGFSEKLSFKVKRLSFKLRAQQLIPFSQTQESELREKEKTPLLFTESLKMGLKEKKFNAHLKAGFFKYQDLPSQVAVDSRLLGNSVTGNEIGAVFDFEYQGWFASFSWDFTWSKNLIFYADADFVENTEAPDTLNRAQSLRLSTRYLTNDKAYEFGPRFSLFSVEPDASPAFYNTSIIGNTNREGFGLGFDLFVKKSRRNKFRVFANYIQANLLNTELNIFQEDQHVITLGISTNFKRMVF